MAKNTAVHVLDDLTGEPAAETVGFGLDGLDYEIDLSAHNAAALREIFDPYVANGRRTGAASSGRGWWPGRKPWNHRKFRRRPSPPSAPRRR